MNAAPRRRRRAPWLLVAFAACSVGDGSDVGPRLPRIPDASCRAVVLDDQGRGVVGATVQLAGTAVGAITGRNGRGDFLANPRGLARVLVDGTDGAAVAGDSLGALTIATDIVGPDLPSVTFLPDLPAAASATLATGTQVAPVIVTSTGGSVVTVPAGGSVGSASGAASVTVRVGELQPQHLPGRLPVALVDTLLFGRGVFVDAGDATCTPGADLDVADDLALGTGSARLFRLDRTSGEWAELAIAATAAAGRITAPGAVDAGGLYVFAAAVPSTTVSGRVIDASTPPLPVVDVRVIVDQWKTTSDVNGNFTVTGVPAVRADGSARQASLELFAGGSWLPVRRALTVAVTALPATTGDLVLDTSYAGNIRVQQVVRGRADVFQPARLSSLLNDVALATTSDANGQVLFEDVPAEYFGFQQGRPIDVDTLLYGQSIGFLDRGRRWLDAYQFLQDRTWYLGGRRSRTYVSDASGGGPLRDAAVVAGIVPDQGFVGLTTEGGTFFVTRDFSGRATASQRSVRDGRTIVHAYSIEVPNGEHLELPLQRVLRTPVGAFDRHGLVAGTLVGADPAQQHALRATRRLSLDEWWDEIVDGIPFPSALPNDVDPAVTHGPFVAGVAAPGGSLAAIQFSGTVDAKTLLVAGIATDVVPVEGARIAQDLPLDLPATTPFDVADALVGLPPEVVVADLRIALALQQANGTVVDVARGIAGNVAPNGSALRLLLPALAGANAGSRWRALIGSSAVSGGATLRHDNLVTIDASGAAPFRFQPFPVITSPAPAAVVPAAGFTVQFALPPGALHGTIELRSDSPTDTLLWQILGPRGQTACVFVRLPTPAVTPLVAGRTYTLTVSAWFGSGLLGTSRDPYGDLSTFVQSIGDVERGVTQVTRRSIQFTTN